MTDGIGLTAALAALTVFLLKEIWGWIKDTNKAHTAALNQNTLAVVKLTCKLELLEEKVDLIPEMKRDLDGLGAKLRNMNESSKV